MMKKRIKLIGLAGIMICLSVGCATESNKKEITFFDEGEVNETINNETADTTDSEDEEKHPSNYQLLAVDLVQAYIDEESTLWMWGYNSNGAFGTLEMSDRTVTYPMKIMEDVKKIERGGKTTFVITNDHVLYGSGYAEYGQLGDGGLSETVYEFKEIMSDVDDVMTRGMYTVIKKTDGSLWYCGYGGTYVEDAFLQPFKVADDVNGFTVEARQVMFIDSAGVLWDVSIDRDEENYVKTPVKIMENVKDVKSFGGNYGVLTANNELWVFDDSDKQLEKVLDNIDSFEVRNCFAAIDKDGALWMWGNNSDYEIGNGNTKYVSAPTKVMEDVKSVKLDFLGSAALKNDGTLWGWGQNYHGRFLENPDSEAEYYGLTDAGREAFIHPVQIMTDVYDFDIGEDRTIVIHKDGTLRQIGEYEDSEDGIVEFPSNE